MRLTPSTPGIVIVTAETTICAVRCHNLSISLVSLPERFRSRFTWPGAVAVPVQQRSQVISRSEHPDHPDALFSSEKLTTFFSGRRQNTKAANAAEIVSLPK